MKKQQKVWRRGAKAAIILSVFFLLAYSLIVLLSRTLRNLEYFTIQDIIASEGKTDGFSYLKGRNIFAVDLAKESRLIARRSPAYKQVRIIRIFPHQLYVDFIKRSPVAYIKLYRYFSVDDEGVLLDSPLPEKLELPVIVGLETKVFGAQPGKQYRLPELKGALSIIKEAAALKLSRFLAISTIDATSLANLSFFIPAPRSSLDNKVSKISDPPGLEVKFGNTAIEQKMALLKELLMHLKADLWNIKYIDLRFKEPVIKFREKRTDAT